MPVTTEANISVGWLPQYYDSGTGGADQSGAYAQKTYLVDYADLWQFIRDIAGGQLVSVGNPPVQLLTTPLQFADGNSNLYANSCTYEALGVNDLGQYTKAKVHVTFKSLPYDTDGDKAFLTEQFKFSGNSITLPNSAYAFADGTPVEANAGKLVPEVEYSITVHQAPSVNTDLITSLVGKVNNAPFFNAAIGTVLFAGADTTRESHLDGSVKMTIQFSFLYRPVPWNKFLHPNGVDYWQFVTDNNGRYAYEDADLNQLFAEYQV